MEKKKIIILGVVIGLVISALGIGLYYILGGNARRIVETTVEKHVAYVKINPSVKLDYSYNCNKFSDDTIECDDPLVYQYELINDDAKEIFKDINLLEGNIELSHVIDIICTKTAEKGIKTDNVEIQSDWKDMENYLTKKQEEKQKASEAATKDTSKEENNEKTEQVTENRTITFNNQNKETINKVIEDDVNKEIVEKKAAEEKAKAEAEAKAKAEAEAKAKAEAAAKAKAAVTIKLSSGVTYCHSMMTYECNNCFSKSLINTLKSAKGHYVKSSSSSSITILRITKLSGSYNSTKYYGGNLLGKITAAGGQNVGGAGGCDDKLTSAVCKQFHLTCG